MTRAVGTPIVGAATGHAPALVTTVLAMALTASTPHPTTATKKAYLCRARRGLGAHGWSV